MFGRKSVYGRLIESTPSKEHVNRYTVRHGGAQPKTNKATDTFEQEYQEFINSLKAKKETKNPSTIECVVDEPVVEEQVETVVEEPVVKEQPKKSRKKKTEPVVEIETVVEDENKQEITEEA